MLRHEAGKQQAVRLPVQSRDNVPDMMESVIKDMSYTSSPPASAVDDLSK